MAAAAASARHTATRAAMVSSKEKDSVGDNAPSEGEANPTHDPETLAKFGLSEEIIKKMGEYQKERKSQQAPLEAAIKPPVVPLAEFTKLQQQLRELQEQFHKENPAAPDPTEEEEEAQEKDRISGGKGEKGKAARKSPY